MIDAVLSTAAADKRGGDLRRRIQLAATASQLRGNKPVEILDLSRNGVMITCPADFAVGEGLVVDLPGLGESPARIVWSKDGRHGCRFDTSLTRAQLSAALLRAAPASIGDVPESLGMRIKRLRRASHFTMIGLAEAVGVSKPTLWKWESDRVRPRDEAVRSLAAALGVDEITLLYGSRGEPKEAVVASSDPAPDPAATPVRGATVAQTIAAAREAIAAHAGVDLERVRIAIDWD